MWTLDAPAFRYSEGTYKKISDSLLMEAQLGVECDGEMIYETVCTPSMQSL